MVEECRPGFILKIPSRYLPGMTEKAPDKQEIFQTSSASVY